MHENEITRVAVSAAVEVHSILGPGLLESVYEAALAHELKTRRLRVERQVPIPVRYKGIHLELGARADMLVESKVILELKSVESIAPVHLKQVLTYLRLADKRVGLLLNFNSPLMRDGIRRIVNGLEE